MHDLFANPTGVKEFEGVRDEDHVSTPRCGVVHFSHVTGDALGLVHVERRHRARAVETEVCGARLQAVV